MSTLTPEGRRLAEELARRHGVGTDAVAEALRAVAAGGGRMAQFSHPELGGNGQWMAGGMIMLGNMFDQGLKARVDALCTDLSAALASADRSAGPLVEPAASGAWWPPELGAPSAAGSQDSMRYAYFADARRLALDLDGEIRVHDTLDHRITGFSQQQGGARGISMSSQHGAVDLGALPVVSGQGGPDEVAPDGPVPVETPASASDAPPADAPAPAMGDAPASASGGDPLELIERLGQLRERGLLSDEEFADKKRELLARL